MRFLSEKVAYLGHLWKHVAENSSAVLRLTKGQGSSSLSFGLRTSRSLSLFSTHVGSQGTEQTWSCVSNLGLDRFPVLGTHTILRSAQLSPKSKKICLWKTNCLWECTVSYSDIRVVEAERQAQPVENAMRGKTHLAGGDVASPHFLSQTPSCMNSRTASHFNRTHRGCVFTPTRLLAFV